LQETQPVFPRTLSDWSDITDRTDTAEDWFWRFIAIKRFFFLISQIHFNSFSCSFRLRLVSAVSSLKIMSLSILTSSWFVRTPNRRGSDQPNKPQSFHHHFMI